MNRREFVKTAVAAAAVTGGAGEVAGATDADALYDRAVVIDALAVGREWDAVEYAAAKQTGYSGIQTSLPNRNLEAAVQGLATWNRRIKEHSDKLVKALAAEDFRAAKDSGRMAVMLGFQNATMIEDDVDNLNVLYDMGTRCIQLTYNSRNLLGDGCTERTNAGLSDFGIEVVEHMNELGILVDLSHCGKQTTFDGIEFTKVPPAFTHTMCEAIYRNHPRAKTDEQMRAISAKGGMVGITAIGYFVGDDPGGETGIEDYVDHIEHAINVAGIDHVGVSSDFPLRGISSWATRENWFEPRLRNFKPAYNVKWPPWIPELDEPERFRNVTHILARRGYSDDHIEKILGLNWLRLFSEILKV